MKHRNDCEEKHSNENEGDTKQAVAVLIMITINKYVEISITGIQYVPES
jgi:hypothetical protein